MMSEREDFEKWGNSTFKWGFKPETWRAESYTNEETQMTWEGWQARAAIAAASQQAYQPRAAMTDDQIMRLAGDMKQRNAGVWPGDVAFARAIEAASGPNAALVEALKETMKMAWVDTREVHFDDTMMFGLGYDFFGWESLRMEIHTSAGSWATWKSSEKYSAYGGPDGSTWLDRFNTREEAEEVVLRQIDKLCPGYPTSIARAALAAAGVSLESK